MQDQAGGQCLALYPDKPIYDIPGIVRCTGRELTQNLLRQITPFSPGFHFNQQVNTLDRQSDGRWHVTTSADNQTGQQFLTRTLFIAAGVGAFVPKTLKIDGLGPFLGRQLAYHPKQLAGYAGQRVVVVGGEEDAVAAAIALAQPGPGQAGQVTLLHRREVLQADTSALAELAALRASGQLQFQAGQITAIQTEGERLCGLVINTPDDQTLSLPLDALLVYQGLSPKLGPVAQWGLTMSQKQLNVSPETLATSESGIYAVGDVVTYPGKKKLIVCGFHEATLAAFAAARVIKPQDSGVLQYTTSSALLQQRLGVFSEISV
ncbi:ferredoxin--NADP reductase [mine drainage metagenome]|uniref:Ferredoxin--NADP reductase n=1 Tax=mine drainage metagenome TaxID=410659 RepID=A0A1J5PWK2_9ZZZZ